MDVHIFISIIKDSMKKVLFVLMTFISFIHIYSEEKNVIRQDKSIINHELDDEYTLYNDDEGLDLSEQEALLEYEQYVCDQVKPPKPSSITAILTNIGCTLLVHYVAFTEKAKIYIAHLKNIIAEWLPYNS